MRDGKLNLPSIIFFLHSYVYFSLVIFYSLIMVLFFCSCYSSGNIKIRFSPVEGTKYFIIFPRDLVLSQEMDGVFILAETNFPGNVSVVVSNGIFDIRLVSDMTCETENKEKSEVKSEKLQRRACKVFIGREILSGEKDFIFWFVLKTELGYYTVPNFILIGDRLFDYVGKIKIEEKNR